MAHEIHWLNMCTPSLPAPLGLCEAREKGGDRCWWGSLILGWEVNMGLRLGLLCLLLPLVIT